MRVVVTATNVDGTLTADSHTTATVLQALPQASVLPVLTGTAHRTQTLSTTQGTWTGSPTSITGQWERCKASGQSCQPATGATGSTYTLGKADEGDTIIYAVSATNPGGTVIADSKPTAVVAVFAPKNTHIPVISGTAQQGQTLTISAVTWNTTADTTYTYAWERCNTSAKSCKAIAGATAQTYTVQSADVGSTLMTAVSATNPDGTFSADSQPTTVALPTASKVATAPATPTMTAVSTPGGTVLAYAALHSDPASPSAEAADATPPMLRPMLTTAEPAQILTAVLATARHSRRAITIKRASNVKGRLLAWACQAHTPDGQSRACTRPVTLPATATTTIKLLTPMTASVRVVIIKTR